MTGKLKFVIAFILVFYACSSVRYHTTFQGSYDPAYDLKNKKVCFTPWYWTEWGKENNVNQSVEKTIYSHFKKELEERELKIEYIDSEDLAYDKEKNTIGIKDTIDYCDYTLNLYYSQNADTVTPPAKSSGSSHVSSDDVNYYNLYIIGTLWTAKNELKGTWRGSITKQSPIPNLDQQAEKMVEQLFKKEFPKIK